MLKIDISKIKIFIKIIIMIGYFGILSVIVFLLFRAENVFRYGFFFNLLIINSIIFVLSYQYNFLKNLNLIKKKYVVEFKKDKFIIKYRLFIFIAQLILSQITLYILIFFNLDSLILTFLPSVLMICANFDFEKIVSYNDKYYVEN
ncbi:MAG: hypothetical protein FWF57_00915 [Defluviitaleaceae bacterium]|nr:hypothetical protein [Defluviitaleaceae bacterium]